MPEEKHEIYILKMRVNTGDDRTNNPDTEKGLSDDVYSKAVVFFGEEQTAQIIMAIITINAWN